MQFARILLEVPVMTYSEVNRGIFALLLFSFIPQSQGRICFEGTQRSFTVSELDGQFCINITRVAAEGDPPSVGYQTMGIGFAAPNFDYIPVPAGGSGFERLRFEDDSESEEFCITILNDTRGCEGPETFSIILDSTPDSSNPCGDEVIITINDTPVNFLFETRIVTQENAERISFDMSRQAGITHLQEITIRLAENSSDPKCVAERRRPYTFQYQCNDPECSDVPDIGGSDTRSDQLELLPDNMIFDGRRECTLVATPVTDCLISFPQGNVVTIVVEDDEAVTIEGKCIEDTDTVWKLNWPHTEPGETAYTLCPSGGTYVGNASRKCSSEGTWEPYVNVRFCYSQEFRDVREKFNVLKDNLHKSNKTSDLLSEPVKAIVSALIANLSRITAPQNDSNSAISILPGDMEIVVNVLDIISNFSIENNLFDPQSPETNETLQNVANIISNVLEEVNKPAFDQNLMNLETMNDTVLSASILESTEELATGIVQTLTELQDKITLVRSNFALQGKRVNYNKKSLAILFPDGVVLGTIEDEELMPRLRIPQGFIKKAIDKAKKTSVPMTSVPEEKVPEEETVLVVSFVLNNIEELLLPEISEEEKTFLPANASIASLIVSSQLQGLKNPTVPKNFEEKVEIAFVLKSSIYSMESTKGMKLQYICAYWANGGWSTSGVKLSKVIFNETTNRTQVICESEHLTSFVVLVSVTDEAPTSGLGFNVLTYIGCGISLICLLLSIIFFLCLGKELVAKAHNYVHLNLCIALTLGLLTFLAGIDTATAVPSACKAVTGLMHYFFLSVFTWSLCEGVLIYNLLVKVFGANERKWIFIYTALGWGIPIPIVIVSAAVRHEYYFRRASYDPQSPFFNDIQACWLPPHLGVIWAFVAPMVLITLVNVILLIISMVSLARNSNNSSKSGNRKFIETGKQLLKTLVILLPLFCFTWVIGLFAVAPEAQVFAYIFIVSNTLQGLFIILLHVVRNEKVWNRIKKCLPEYRIKGHSNVSSRGADSRGHSTIKSILHMSTPTKMVNIGEAESYYSTAKMEEDNESIKESNNDLEKCYAYENEKVDKSVVTMATATAYEQRKLGK